MKANKKTLTVVVLAAFITASVAFYGLQLPAPITQALPTPQTYIYQVHMPKDGEKVVCIVFDDGWKSQYDTAVPIMDKYGFKATFGIITSYPDKNKNYMDWNQIVTLAKSGQDIESHSVSHSSLNSLSEAGLQYQMMQSKLDLLKYGINAPIFIYPFGDGAGNQTVEALAAQNYLAARSTVPDILNMTGSFDRYALPSYTMGNETSFEDFLGYVNQASNQTVVSLYYHRISTDDVSTAVTPQLFEAEMQYLHDNGFTVVTMKDLFMTAVS
jgi:peptidoglycan/xylan/chitin deacetylase (PgdA/CDA1 family)